MTELDTAMNNGGLTLFWGSHILRHHKSNMADNPIWWTGKHKARTLYQVEATTEKTAQGDKRERAVRDWSLITGRGGGATKREGRAREVLPLQKGGGKF